MAGSAALPGGANFVAERQAVAECVEDLAESYRIRRAFKLGPRSGAGFGGPEGEDGLAAEVAEAEELLREEEIAGRVS